MSTGEWIRKMWYVYVMEYYSAIKEWNNTICSNMDGPRDCYTEWNKSDRERHILVWHPLYAESKKKQMSLTKQK